MRDWKRRCWPPLRLAGLRAGYAGKAEPRRKGCHGRGNAGACSSPRPLPACSRPVNPALPNRPSTRPSRSRTSPSCSAIRLTRSLNPSNRSPISRRSSAMLSFVSLRNWAVLSLASRRIERFDVAIAIKITIPVVTTYQASGATTTTSFLVLRGCFGSASAGVWLSVNALCILGRQGRQRNGRKRNLPCVFRHLVRKTFAISSQGDTHQRTGRSVTAEAGTEPPCHRVLALTTLPNPSNLSINLSIPLDQSIHPVEQSIHPRHQNPFIQITEQRSVRSGVSDHNRHPHDSAGPHHGTHDNLLLVFGAALAPCPTWRVVGSQRACILGQPGWRRNGRMRRGSRSGVAKVRTAGRRHRLPRRRCWRRHSAQPLQCLQSPL